MSSIYITEPATSGKVLIKTTYGDVDVELWSKEAPLACRNFIQLCLEGYYDDCPIHRIIKGFMAQTGDPTGTGTGGESVWGKPFKDEIHSRISFNHRGQVAMANEQKPNSNHSQFFITFDSCEWLNRKHTIFGKVAGPTMFNLLRLNDVEVDASERPLEPVKILGCEVLNNPFDDIITRDLSASKSKSLSVAAAAAGGKAANIKKEISSRKATKDLKLLSFGDDEEEDGIQAEEAGSGSIRRKTIHSSHDSKFKDERLSSDVAEDVLESTLTTDAPVTSKAVSMRAATLAKLKATQLGRQLQPNSTSSEVDPSNYEEDNAVGYEDYEEKVSTTVAAPKSGKSEEFKDLREQLLRSKKAVKILTGTETRTEDVKNDVLTPLERQRQKYLKRKHQHGDRESDTLARLSSFTAKLKKGKGESEHPTGKTEAVAYHGQVLEKGSDDEGEDLQGWSAAPLKFKSHIDDKHRGGDGRALSDYVVLDDRRA